MAGKLEPDGRGGYEILSPKEAQRKGLEEGKAMAALVMAALLGLAAWFVMWDLSSPTKKLVLLAAIAGGFTLGWYFARFLVLAFAFGVLALLVLGVVWWVFS